MTSIRADVDQKFIRRFLFVAIGCFLFMLWGLYDGLYKEPKDLQRSLAYKKLTERQESGEITESERATLWDTMTAENGWESTKPDTPENEQNDIYFQWFVFGVGLVCGVFFLTKYLRLLNTWVEADDGGVTSSWGDSLKFKDIKQIDKKKWPKKGIAKIEYANEAGAKKTMVFDDFKYSRKKMAEIMKLAEANLSDDQIIGDIRESEKPNLQESATEDRPYETGDDDSAEQ